MSVLLFLTLGVMGLPQDVTSNESIVPERPDFEAELAGGEPRFHFFESVEPRQKVFQIFDRSDPAQVKTWSFVQNLAGGKLLLLQFEARVEEKGAGVLLEIDPEDRAVAALQIQDDAYLPAALLAREELEEGAYPVKETAVWNLRTVDNLKRLAVFRKARIFHLEKWEERGWPFAPDVDQRRALLWFLYQHVDGGQADYAEWWATAKLQLDPSLPRLASGHSFSDSDENAEKRLVIPVEPAPGSKFWTLRSTLDGLQLESDDFTTGRSMADANTAGGGVRLIYRGESGERVLESAHSEQREFSERIAWNVSPADLLGICSSLEVEFRGSSDQSFHIIPKQNDREAIRWFVHFQIDGGAELESEWWKRWGQWSTGGMRIFPPPLDLEATFEAGGGRSSRFETKSRRGAELVNSLTVYDGARSRSSPMDSPIDSRIDVAYVESERGESTTYVYLHGVRIKGHAAGTPMDVLGRLPDGTAHVFQGALYGSRSYGCVRLVLESEELLLLSDTDALEVRLGDETRAPELSTDARNAFRWFVYHRVPGGRGLAYEHWKKAYWRRPADETEPAPPSEDQ